MDADYLVVGLGNPGTEYHHSPHNAGFEVAEQARALCRGPRFSVRGDAAVTQCRWRGQSLFLLKPLTFMNRSGVEVARWMRREALPLDRLIVCYDDLDLPLGHVRLRLRGGAGGHHGMESILEELGSGDFPRVRLGIQEREVERAAHVDYLLTPLDGERWSVLEEAAGRAAEAVLEAVHVGFVTAMNRFNRRRSAEVVSEE